MGKSNDCFGIYGRVPASYDWRGKIIRLALVARYSTDQLASLTVIPIYGEPGPDVNETLSRAELTK